MVTSCSSRNPPSGAALRALVAGVFLAGMVRSGGPCIGRRDHIDNPLRALYSTRRTPGSRSSTPASL